MKLLISISILAFLFLFPLFHSEIYSSHDGENHIARIASYYQAFHDGHFPPRWAGNLNFGYGTPVLLFFYPLPGYLGSIIHSIGFSFVSSFKVLIGISFIAAFLTFYFWARTIFKANTAILGALLYGLAPYHFLNLYVRGDIGEMLAFVFVPLVFFSIERSIQTKKQLFLLLGGVFYGLLILSHNGVSLMFSPIFLLYGLVRSNHTINFVHVVTLLFLGLLFSAFFWIPALYEGKYVNAHVFIGHMYQTHFPTLLQVISSYWGFGAEVGKPGGLSPQIGLLYVLFVVASSIVWLKTKRDRKIIGMWISVFFAALFITQPLSTILWNSIPMLRLYEFPWRFIGLASFAAVVLACFVLERIESKKTLFVVGFVLLLTSIPFVQVQGYETRDDAYYTSFTGTTYYHGEASPIWTAGDPGKFAKEQIEIIGGKGSIGHIMKKTQAHIFTVNAHSDLTVLDNTLYFPGWRAVVDGQEAPIQFQDPNHRGLITFQVPQGRHSVQVQFKESKVRLFADLISLAAVILLVVFFTKTLLYNKK